MTITQLNRSNLQHGRSAARISPEVAGSGQSSGAGHRLAAVSDAVMNFPRRPDATVINESIPLFYIGRNRNGFWVAREAEARTGGLFLFKRSALRFANRNSAPIGCARMFLGESVELDVVNQGSPLVALLASAVAVATHRAPLVATFIGMAAAEWRNLVAEILRPLAGERGHRQAIEGERLHGQYSDR